MSETWWAVPMKYVNEPRPVEVERDTPQYVVFPNGRREAKSSEFTTYVQTWDEAVELLVRRAERRLDSKRRAVEYCEQELASAKAIRATPPTEREVK